MITGYKLESCPFCKATQAYLHIRRNPRYTQVRCGRCGAEGPSANTEIAAVDKWNATRIRNGKLEDAIDTSRWWLVSPCKSGYPCVNDNGDPVDLNSAQARDDYKFYKELHLDSDTTENIGCGAIRYKPGAPVPMMRDCVVYGHNVRHGYWKNTTHSETEAINVVRVNMTKRLNFGDAI